MAKDLTPGFPPLLQGHRVDTGKNPFQNAQSRAVKGSLSAGDLVWSSDTDELRYAIVLEPDVDRSRCGEMVHVAMVAFADAAGAICPPEISFTFRWPSLLLMNEAVVGAVDIAVSEAETDGIPDWLVLGTRVRIRPGRGRVEPGHAPDRTSMWDEGSGSLTRTELLEAVARHLVNWLHTWSEEGCKPVHQYWWQRRSDKVPLADGLAPEQDGELIGMDETGSALIRSASGVSSLSILDAVVKLRALAP